MNINMNINMNVDMNGFLNSYAYYVFLNIPSYILSIKYNKNYYFIQIHKDYVLMMTYYLYNDLNSKFKQLVDMTCVDYFLKRKRFNIVYNILSVDFHQRVFLKFFLSELDSIPSLIYIYPNVSWYEREIWDFFGVYFINNKYMKRIMLDYGFVGHPFRKDFPLTGFIELAYSYFFSNVIQKKVNLSQMFRKFETNTVWSRINSIEENDVNK
jgi:NADH:ubiquinone oxidoreductase subunit C